MGDTECSEHSEPFKMYCKTCPKQVCLTCIVGNLHRGHEFEKLDIIALVKGRELEEYVTEKLPQRKQALSLKIETIRNLRRKNAESRDTIKVQLERRKQAVIEHVDTEYQHLVADLDGRSEENDKVLAGTENFCNKCMNNLKELEDFCRGGIESRSCLEVVRKREDVDKVDSDISSVDTPMIEFSAFKESQEFLPDKIKLFGKIGNEIEASLSVQVAKEIPDVFYLFDTETIEVQQKFGIWPFEETYIVVSSVCVGRDGEIWVSCQGSKKISRLDSSGKHVRTIDRNFTINAMALANDQKKLLILSTNRVRQMQLDTEICSDFIHPKNLYPTAMCTTDKDEVLLCVVDSFSRTNSRADDKSKRLLLIYSDKGELMKAYDNVDGKTFGLPKYVAYDNANNTICVFDMHCDELVAFDRKPNLKYRYRAKNITAICYEPYGYLVVANEVSNSIYFVDQSGHLKRKVAGPWNISPRSMALDTYGQILIGTSEGKILKIKYNNE